MQLTSKPSARESGREDMHALSVYFPPMSDPHDDNHYSFTIYPVYHAIVTNANPKMVRLCLELFASRRKRILAERGDFLADSPLKLPVEVPELPRGRCREFEDIAHGR